MNFTCRRLTGSLAAIIMTAGFATGTNALPASSGLSVSADADSITVSLSLEFGAASAGYRYSIYRGVDPAFVPSPKNLIATSENLDTAPYIDRAGLKTGMMYYYKVVAAGPSGVLNAVPISLGNVKTDSPLSAAAQLEAPAVDVVFIGDSITQAGYLTEQQSPCAVCAQALRTLHGIHTVKYSNQGHSGHTTKDYLPGGSDFTAAESAAREITAGNRGQLVFSIMLGTNDSAMAGTNGAAAPAEIYTANMKAIVDHLLADYPACKVFLNKPLWYSPNTHNGATYEEGGLARLATYLPAIDSLAASYGKSKRGRVFVGDTTGFAYFAANYRTDLVAEDGRNGTFYLHPNLQGAATLGRLWAASIADTLFGGRRDK